MNSEADVSRHIAFRVGSTKITNGSKVPQTRPPQTGRRIRR